MSEDEEEEFYDAIHELNYYVSCGYLIYKIIDNSDNNYHVDYTVQKSDNNIVSSIKKNIRIFELYLETGKAVLSVNKNGKQIIRPATITKRYHYPVSYFNGVSKNTEEGENLVQ